jgi:hypothetical protein
MRLRGKEAQMTDEQINIAIAEACGWKDCHLSASWASIIGTLYEVNGNQYAMIPDYLNDLNAMHEAMKTLSPKMGVEFCWHLNDMGISGEWDMLTATAALLAEAFLRTLQNYG